VSDPVSLVVVIYPSASLWYPWAVFREVAVGNGRVAEASRMTLSRLLDMARVSAAPEGD
jgi:hypothetical protein